MTSEHPPEDKNKEQAASEKAGDGRDQAAWIAEVSHELRLPIANVRLLVETLLDGAVEDIKVARRMLERTKQEVDRLQSLVSDLLSVEKLASTPDMYDRQWVPLGKPARYALETVREQARESGVSVLEDIEPGFFVYANSDQLDQVLLNLVENAVKFTPKGGTVTIKSHGAGVFSVEDTGIGMPEQEIPRIFQRFYRIDRSKTKGSTGLGLSIVKSIVDLHGAKISVTSKEGLGSSFTLEFPGPRA